MNESITALGYTAQQGVAPTLEAGGVLLARDRGPNVVLSVSDLPHAIGALPLTRLALPLTVMGHLRASGLQLIQEVQAVPIAALARRFDPDVAAQLLIVQGELQSELGVIHVIAEKLRDYSHWLGALPTSSRDFH